jgi:23S rRNA pseudouridine2605 synthase
MNVTQNDMDRMLKGLHLEDGEIAVDDVRYVDANDHKQVGVQIHSGKNRIVRRIFEHLGYEVEKLDRVYFAGLTKLNVPRGTWRFLTDTEVNKLKAGFFK